MKKTPKGPWMDTNAKQDLFGPGTPTFYKNQAGEDLMSIQVWEHTGGKGNKKNNGQSMRTYKIDVNAGYDPKATFLRFDE